MKTVCNVYQKERDRGDRRIDITAICARVVTRNNSKTTILFPGAEAPRISVSECTRFSRRIMHIHTCVYLYIHTYRFACVVIAPCVKSRLPDTQNSLHSHREIFSTSLDILSVKEHTWCPSSSARYRFYICSSTIFQAK